MHPLAPEFEQTLPDGATLWPLKEIATYGGPVLHMLRCDAPYFTAFGELYFSEVEARTVKGWKRHKRQTQLFAVPMGRIKIVLYDTRSHSPTQGQRTHILLGRPGHYHLLRIPPLIWYAFGALDNIPALIANCADIPHDPEESEKMPLRTPGMVF